MVPYHHGCPGTLKSVHEFSWCHAVEGPWLLFSAHKHSQALIIPPGHAWAAMSTHEYGTMNTHEHL